MLNSVFRSVGQIGTSKGTPIEPTDSGGMGLSGMHGPGLPAAAIEAVQITTSITAIRMPVIRIVISPHPSPNKKS
jgi:hypothetical protein